MKAEVQRWAHSRLKHDGNEGRSGASPLPRANREVRGPHLITIFDHLSILINMIFSYPYGIAKSYSGCIRASSEQDGLPLIHRITRRPSQCTDDSDTLLHHSVLMPRTSRLYPQPQVVRMVMEFDSHLRLGGRSRTQR